MAGESKEETSVVKTLIILLVGGLLTTGGGVANTYLSHTYSEDAKYKETAAKLIVDHYKNMMLRERGTQSSKDFDSDNAKVSIIVLEKFLKKEDFDFLKKELIKDYEKSVDSYWMWGERAPTKTFDFMQSFKTFNEVLTLQIFDEFVVAEFEDNAANIQIKDSKGLDRLVRSIGIQQKKGVIETTRMFPDGDKLRFQVKVLNKPDYEDVLVVPQEVANEFASRSKSQRLFEQTINFESSYEQ